MRTLEERAIQEEERTRRRKEKSIARGPSVSTRLGIEPVQEMLSNDPGTYRSHHPPYEWRTEGEDPKGEGSKPPKPNPGNPKGDEEPYWDRRSRRSRGSGYPSDSDGPSDPGSPRGHRTGRRRRHRRDDSDSEGWDRNLKMKHPTPYDGKPDIQKFDQWIASILNYADVMKIRERTMIGLMSEYVSGQAKDFYIEYVAGKLDNWTFDSLFQAMFEECFPRDVYSVFCEKWNKCTQGQRSVREYSRELYRLSKRFREMTERTVVLKFWDGVNSDIRSKLIGKEVDPETANLNEIITQAENAEKRIEAKKRARGKPTEGERPKPKREWTRFKNRTGGNKNFKPGGREDRPTQNKPENVRANAISPQNIPDRKGKGTPNQRKLSRSKMDELRAQGRCFNCQEVGHEQHNCPRLSSMRPPKPAVRTGAVNLTKMDKLAAKKEKADVFLRNVSMMEHDPIAEEL
jgi:hypothetical protein